MHVKYKSSFWIRDCSTSWIMLEDASVENKVFRTNFINLVYTSLTNCKYTKWGFGQGREKTY